MFRHWAIKIAAVFGVTAFCGLWIGEYGLFVATPINWFIIFGDC